MKTNRFQIICEKIDSEDRKRIKAIKEQERIKKFKKLKEASDVREKS